VIGSQIGKYRVVSLLGEGGMGAVYKAIHDGLDRWVAIKVLHSKFASRSDMMSRFQNEARAANLVKHPSLVEIYDTDRLPDGSIYLVMELLDGEALDALIERRQKRLPLKRALRIAWQLADAMAAVHGKNIVHRDTTRKNKICSLTGHKAIHRRRTDDADALFTHWPL
jgi:serine/threonine protein kinase